MKAGCFTTEVFHHPLTPLFWPIFYLTFSLPQMKGIFIITFLFAVVAITSAANKSTTAATGTEDHEQLATSLHQNEPNQIACFPFCQPEYGKREELSREKQAVTWDASELTQDEQPARELKTSHPKFRHWFDSEDEAFSSPDSPPLQSSKRQQQQRAEGTWKRTGSRDSPNNFQRVTSYRRGGRYHLPRANLI